MHPHSSWYVSITTPSTSGSTPLHYTHHYCTTIYTRPISSPSTSTSSLVPVATFWSSSTFTCTHTSSSSTNGTRLRVLVAQPQDMSTQFQSPLHWRPPLPQSSHHLNTARIHGSSFESTSTDTTTIHYTNPLESSTLTMAPTPLQMARPHLLQLDHLFKRHSFDLAEELFLYTPPTSTTPTTNCSTRSLRTSLVPLQKDCGNFYQVRH